MSTSPQKTIIAFDLYGTILSTSSIATKLSELLSISPERANQVAELWRRYQLEYTWRANSMKKYQSFSQITHSSLHHALLDSSLSIPSHMTKEVFSTAMLEAYDNLTTFPDADTGLALLSSSFPDTIDAYIFSNGTPSMLSSSLSSPHLTNTQSSFKALISIDEIKIFKPAPEAYLHLATKVGKSKEEVGSIWLVSSNPFDVVGAKNVGMKAAWVDRSGKGWVDGLGGEEGKPDLIVKGVNDAVRGIEGWARTG